MEVVRESDEEFSDNETPTAYYYEGERNDQGERHGAGKARLPNGDSYEGEYEHGFRHGFGKYVFRKLKGKTRNACYVGCYEKNKKNGQGTFFYPDGAKYEGIWREDLRQGYGKYYYTNGDVYKGDWERDKRHGQGIYTYAASGMVYEGQWIEGKRSGRGKLTFGKQCYVGSFHDDKMLGPGTYIFPNGCQQHGEYVIVEDDPDENEKEIDDSEADRGVKTKETRIKWISRGGLHSPVTIIKKETLIN